MPNRSRRRAGTNAQALALEYAFAKVRSSGLPDEAFHRLIAVASGLHDHKMQDVRSWQAVGQKLKPFWRRALRDHDGLTSLLLGKRDTSSRRTREKTPPQDVSAQPGSAEHVLLAHKAYLGSLAWYLNALSGISDFLDLKILDRFGHDLPKSRPEALKFLREEFHLTYPELALLVLRAESADPTRPISERVLAARAVSYRQAVYACGKASPELRRKPLRKLVPGSGTTR